MSARTPKQKLRALWREMIRRCTNPKDPSFIWYGARGITVCDRWLSSFDAFFEDMGLRPVGCSIDRINNDGPYSPDNCRWATAEEQARNRPQWQSLKTHCPQGHPYDEVNTWISPRGDRHCIACSRKSTKEWRDKQRGGPAKPYGAAKTHCDNGHEFTPENTGRKTNGGRRCRACDREREAKKRAAQRAEIA